MRRLISVLVLFLTVKEGPMKTICRCFPLFLISLLVSIAGADDDWMEKFHSITDKPSPRNGHDMAYIGGDQVLLFGGLAVGLPFSDETWVYDLSANTWTARFPAMAPSARWQHSIAHISGDQILLFGGNDGTNNDGETWVYQLGTNTWTQTTLATAPSPRVSHAMAYIGGNQVLLFGGFDASGDDDETWVYDLNANTWTEKSPVSSPSPRNGHDMAYIGGDKVLLFGGKDGAFDDETWIYELGANTWTQQSPATKPIPRWLHGMAYLGGDGVLLFGGKANLDLNGTWAYDLSANTWTPDTMDSLPPLPRNQLGFSETSMDGSSFLVMFGGINVTGSLNETWTFGGGDFSLPVLLSTFIGTITQNGVRLQWRTESETNNIGFHVYRNTAKVGDYVRVSPSLIRGHGTDSTPYNYSFLDETAEKNQFYWYLIEDIDFSGITHRSDPIQVDLSRKAVPLKTIPTHFVLYQNFPNPFNPETWMPYELPADTAVTITIYNMQGSPIRTLELGTQPVGSYLVKDKATYWDGRGDTGERVSSGIYYYHFQAEDYSATRKMLILK